MHDGNQWQPSAANPAGDGHRDERGDGVRLVESIALSLQKSPTDSWGTQYNFPSGATRLTMAAGSPVAAGFGGDILGFGGDILGFGGDILGAEIINPNKHPAPFFKLLAGPDRGWSRLTSSGARMLPFSWSSPFVANA